MRSLALAFGLKSLSWQVPCGSAPGVLIGGFLATSLAAPVACAWGDRAIARVVDPPPP